LTRRAGAALCCIGACIGEKNTTIVKVLPAALSGLDLRSAKNSHSNARKSESCWSSLTLRVRPSTAAGKERAASRIAAPSNREE
jgi:hypothetical protein